MSSAFAASRGFAPSTRSAVAGVGTYLPERVMTTADVEVRLRERCGAPELLPRFASMLGRSGVVERRYIDPADDVSDLAVRAARSALSDAGVAAEDVPLLIFASGSQDLIEPATAHLVNLKLGGAKTVFDVKNACNSFLNGLQVADAMIRSGSFERALVCTGEAPSLAVNWSVRTRHELREAFAGYTLGDAGAAVVLEARTDGAGIEHVSFRSGSRHWDLCTVRGGGSMHEYAPEHRWFRGDGNVMRAAFEEWGRTALDEMLEPTGTVVEDYDVVLVHQVTGAFFEAFLDVSRIPVERTVPIVDRLGNIASASIPVQLERARASGRLTSGAKVLVVGLGAGISLGLMTLRM